MVAAQSAALIVCNRGGRLTGWSLEWEKDWNQQHHQQAAQNHKWKAHSGVVQEVVAARTVHHEICGVRHRR